MRQPHTVALDSHAAATLRYIRASMEAAGTVAVSGSAGVTMGAVGLLAAALASSPALRPHWLIVWLILLLVPLLFVVFVVGLGMRALNVGRAAGRFAKEAGDLTGEIAREGERAASHQRGRRPGRRDHSSTRRR